MFISLVFAVIATILAAYFASNNLSVIRITLLGYPIQQTSGILLVWALGIGVLLGVLFTLPMVVSSRWELIRQKRKMQDWQDAEGRKYAKGELPE